MEELYRYIPDAGATVVFVVFMLLWHRRTSARDEMWGKLMGELTKGIMDCIKSMKSTPPLN